MKRLLIASALTMMALSGVASADDRDDRDDREEYEEALREDWEDREEDRREFEKERREAEREYWKDRREAQREYEKERREELKEREKAYRRWARGEHLSRDYLTEPYYVRDYAVYELAPPPRGHVWVRPYPEDDTYYLVQLATGVIARVLGGN